MIGIVLVSHSKKITDGIKEMIEEMTGVSDKVSIASCGGTDDGRMGTNAIAILEAITSYESAEHVYLFADIGSAILSAEMAMELIEDEALQEKVELVDCPLVEGAFAAAIQASVGGTKEDILREIASV